MGDYKKKMLEYLVKVSKNPQIKELGVDGLAALLTGKNIKNAVKRSGGNVLINAFIIFIIVLQAFFPKIATYTTIVIAIIFIIALVAIAFAVVGTSGTSLMLISSAITDFILPLFVLLIVSVIIKMVGSPNYYDFLFKHYGGLVAFGSLVLSLLIGFGIASVKGTGKFLALSTLYGIFLLIILPIIIAQASSNPWGLCSKLPFVENYCNPRETIVSRVSYVHIPTKGGIGVEIDTSNTLYAGEVYEFRYRITNYYEKPIEFHVKPVMESYFGDVEFQPQYNQIKATLKPNEYYDDSVVVDPNNLAVSNEGNCYYTIRQIATYNNLNVSDPNDLSKIECAVDKPCENSSMTCVSTDNYECKCVDWTRATCSGEDIYAKLYIQHTGFLLGKADLYVYNYSKTHYIPPAAKGVELTQGPLTVKIYLYPNPYIIGIHDYRKSITMYATFKSNSGDIKITNFKVKPLTLNVTTIDKEKHVKLEESIGWKLISCKDIKGLFIPSGSEISYVLCKLTPPFIQTKLTIYNPESSKEKIIVNNASLDKLYEYCNEENQQQASPPKPKSNLPTMTAILAGNEDGLSWSYDWNDIYKYIDKTGLCEILKSNNNTQKDIIESALNHTSVVVEFDYTRNFTSESLSIKPYTLTDKCIKLGQK